MILQPTAENEVKREHVSQFMFHGWKKRVRLAETVLLQENVWPFLF